MLCLHAACSQPAIGHQHSQPRRSAVWDRAMAGLLLFVDSFINRCYLLVSGSVRVRVRARVSAKVTVRDRDRI